MTQKINVYCGESERMNGNSSVQNHNLDIRIDRIQRHQRYINGTWHNRKRLRLIILPLSKSIIVGHFLRCGWEWMIEWINQLTFNSFLDYVKLIPVFGLFPFQIYSSPITISYSNRPNYREEQSPMLSGRWGKPRWWSIISKLI